MGESVSQPIILVTAHCRLPTVYGHQPVGEVVGIHVRPVVQEIAVVVPYVRVAAVHGVQPVGVVVGIRGRVAALPGETLPSFRAVAHGVVVIQVRDAVVILGGGQPGERIIRVSNDGGGGEGSGEKERRGRGERGQGRGGAAARGGVRVGVAMRGRGGRKPLLKGGGLFPGEAVRVAAIKKGRAAYKARPARFKMIQTMRAVRTFSWRFHDPQPDKINLVGVIVHRREGILRGRRFIQPELQDAIVRPGRTGRLPLDFQSMHAVLNRKLRRVDELVAVGAVEEAHLVAVVVADEQPDDVPVRAAAAPGLEEREEVPVVHAQAVRVQVEAGAVTRFAGRRAILDSLAPGYSVLIFYGYGNQTGNVSSPGPFVN